MSRIDYNHYNKHDYNDEQAEESTETDRLLTPADYDHHSHNGGQLSPPTAYQNSEIRNRLASKGPRRRTNPLRDYQPQRQRSSKRMMAMKDEEMAEGTQYEKVELSDSQDEAHQNGADGLMRTDSPPPRRRRRRPPLDRIRIHHPPRGGNSLMLRLTCLSVLTLVFLGGLSLLTYFQDGTQKNSYQFIPAGATDNLSGGGTNDENLNSGVLHNLANGNVGPYLKYNQAKALQQLMEEAGIVEPSRPPRTVRYNPQGVLASSTAIPWDFDTPVANPLSPLLPTGSAIGGDLGYLRQPHLVNQQLVFCSQGDIYITSVAPNSKDGSQPLPAAKLTTTVGNALDPRLHPNLRYLAYTATYSGRRDLYLLDLQGGSPAVRLTYWDLGAGISGLVGWWGNALVFRAVSNRASLPDLRLYALHLDHLDDSSSEPVSVLETTSIPLSQARDAARFEDCWYFVRYAQSSHTIRYVGGTAEQLYRYCDEASTANRLFREDYNGTSKDPQMYGDSDYLFFLSDRGRVPGSRTTKWQPDRMNVWAVRISSDESLPKASDGLIQITDTACDFEGRVIQEYSVDSATGDMVVRIGADFYWMTADTIRAKLNKGRRRSLQYFDEDTGDDYVIDGEPIDSIGNQTNTTQEAVIEDTLRTSVNSKDSSGFKKEDEDEDEDEDDEKEEESDFETELLDDVDFDSNDIETNETDIEEEEPGTLVYYSYEPPAMESRIVEDKVDHVSGISDELSRLPIAVHSDFHTYQERMIPVDMMDHFTSGDVYTSTMDTLQFVMTLRGQLWVAPAVTDDATPYGGSGRNMPERRYRLAPGANMGGSVRILGVRHVPNPVEDDTSDRRLAVILATDPLTETAEHAFYLIETQASASPLFLDFDHLPKPFLGGHLSGGSTRDGGLGSVVDDSWTISPCGRRMAWTDKDGRILVMNLPQYQKLPDGELAEAIVLPTENENGQPMLGDDKVDLIFSPGGRYLAVEHNARNQFGIISIADLGDPEGEDRVADIQIGRIVQATPDRFNSYSATWGQTTSDMHFIEHEAKTAQLLEEDPPEDVATTLFFLSDRDISTDVTSPWGTRQPMPHFKKQCGLYALPLTPVNGTTNTEGPYGGGGAAELRADAVLARKAAVEAARKATSRRRLSRNPLSGAFGLAENSFTKRRFVEESNVDTEEEIDNDDEGADEFLRLATFPKDMDIDFGPERDQSLSFAREAYRLAQIPEGNYLEILSQTPDDGSFILLKWADKITYLVAFLADGYPSDGFTEKTFKPTDRSLKYHGKSTNGDYLWFGFGADGQFSIAPNTASGIKKLMGDTELDENIVSSRGLHLSIWPSREYRQLYDDAWRMLRDYYYDADMTGIDWNGVHTRYLPLVSRCAKREELDDVLIQMASELSALHVFVYGGEYDSPMHGDYSLKKANTVASFGAALKRNAQWNGYEILSIPESDPDFTLVNDRSQVYSPLSHETLRLSGQKGLEVGDIIVAVNGESVMSVPDINALLRGTAGSSVRLDVLRLASGDEESVGDESEAVVEPVLAVPLDPEKALDLLYDSWEWKTKQQAEKLAEESGFSVGYVHLQSMSGAPAENAFARGFFPDYKKDGFILDVRHNRGGNIDAWVLSVLQREAWQFWQSRDYGVDNGGIGWDQHFAFRGHIVVLVDEKTSSDGEGVSRGISELGLGRLVGTRTWGGGIWLKSDNRLVDGGLASAPEIGTYNENFGWGLGIENLGVDPDVVVDNDPFETFNGKDSQLEAAILELKKWLEEEPVVVPKPPARKKDVTMGDRECRAR